MLVMGIENEIVYQLSSVYNVRVRARVCVRSVGC